ncbi:MAG: hypothetical protein ACFFE8_12165 [Candidatus Heimdallarchaeota archaeon]
MKIIYKFYKPNEGLEEIQAQIFNYNTGFKSTAEEIKDRYRQEKTNPRFIRYAFSEEGKPLAYIQARVSKDKNVLLGYPWAYPECPEKVQDILFDEMLAYVKKKEPKQISYWILDDWEKQIEFFKRKGFQLTTEGFCYDFEVKSLSSHTSEGVGHTVRIATPDDVDLLVELGSVDKEMKRHFSRTWLKDYFTNKVLRDGHCVLVFDREDQIICSSAPLRWKDEATEEEYIMLRFTATRPGHENAWEPLVIAIAKECAAIGWTDLPLRVYGEKNSVTDRILKKYNPKPVSCYNLYTMKQEG